MLHFSVKTLRLKAQEASKARPLLPLYLPHFTGRGGTQAQPCP